MRRPAKSFPHQNAAARPLGQQAFQTNPLMQNSCNMLQSSMPVQAQSSMFNPQMSVPLGNSNVPPLLNQAGFMNVPNQLLPAQNNHLGVPQFGSFVPLSQHAQCNVGFGPQLGVPNLNNVSILGQFSNAIQNANQFNPSQSPGQFLPNLLNLAQQFNQNGGLPNGQQLCLQNPIQNMSQPLPMHIPNHSQFLPGMGCPNPNLLANLQLALMQSNQQMNNSNQQNLVDMNSSKPSPSATSQIQVNSCPVQPLQTQSMQSSGFRRPQGISAKNGQISKNFQGRNFPRRTPQSGSQMAQVHQVDNAKRKGRFSNEHKGKGPRNNENAAKFPRTNFANPDKEKKRPIALTYSEQEIQQWREERKKNYPSKTNLEKKLTGKLVDSEVAKIRREQLKEILAKQAELGIEVADIPSHYLLDSENKVHGSEDKRKPSNKKGRFDRRNHKRGRFDKKNQFSQKQKLTEGESVNTASSYKRNPTLLEKLLSADIREDKIRLLQVFRFMVMNNFFKDSPEKPLKFPFVAVKDGGEVTAGKSLVVGKDISETSNKTIDESVYHDNDIEVDDSDDGCDGKNNNVDDDDEIDENGTQVDQVSQYIEKKPTIRGLTENEEEEEGEIVECSSHALS